MRTNTRALIVGIAMTTGFGGLMGGAMRGDVAATTPSMHPGTEARIKQCVQIAKQGTAKLVFIGDSITEGWDGAGKDVWAKHYASRAAANFGIGGDRTEHVLWRLDHGNVDGLSPTLIVLMIGTNNTGHNQTKPEETAAGVKAIIERLQAQCAGAKILLLGIFPRGASGDDPLRQINTKINAILKTYADGERVMFKDIGGVFLDEHGVLSTEIMPDLLHLSPRGYELWAEAIEADIAKVMGPQ